MADLVKGIRDDAGLRESFMALANRVFDLSFEDWYRAGFWTDRYLPYAMAEGGRVIANASVNRISAVWNGQPRRYIQVGTVMTDPDFRHRGLAARLIREILRDWGDRCDGVYLYANRDAVGFYPQFGFAPGREYQYAATIQGRAGDFRPLDVGTQLELLRRCYQQSNPYSALPVADNFGLLMFYCGGMLRDCVYYSPSLDMVCVAERTGEELLIYDLFGPKSCPLEEAAARMAGPSEIRTVLGFTPLDPAGWDCAPVESEDTFFLWKDTLFGAHRLMFPLLSHA